MTDPGQLEVVTIAATDLEASFVPAAGMVCTSLRHRGEELLGQRHGLRGYVEDRSTMGIPLLYPWANRLGTDRFELAGRAIDLGAASELVKRDDAGLPIHGLLTAHPGWELRSHEPRTIEASFEWSRDGRLLAAFPFPHRITLRAEIGDGGLAITTRLKADGDSPLPVAFGFHPYLAPPGAARESWRLGLPLGERVPLDDRGLPAGAPEPRPDLDGRLKDRSFDDLFTSAPAGTALTLEAAGRRLSIAMDAAFPYTQLYSPAEDELFAIEPMAAATNALIAEPLLLEPGAGFSARFTVGVEAI